jgi:hypothetical protein
MVVSQLKTLLISAKLLEVPKDASQHLIAMTM